MRVLKSTPTALRRRHLPGPPVPPQREVRAGRIFERRAGHHLAVLKRVSGVAYQCGGEEPTGWLPPGAAIPLPTPVRNLTLDMTIEDDGGSGVLLVFAAKDDPNFHGDYWFDDLTAAVAMAEEWFGIEQSRWQDD